MGILADAFKRPSAYSGQVYGRWTVIGNAPHLGTQPRLLCRCECGTERAVKRHAVVTGTSLNCGCGRNETLGKRMRKHGHAAAYQRSRAYIAWCNMLRRCERPEHPSFKYYGARGIQVCDRWKEFSAFLQDMGEPGAGLTLDRIDNDRGYDPENCRWATQAEQNRNKRQRGTC